MDAHLARLLVEPMSRDSPYRVLRIIRVLRGPVSSRRRLLSGGRVGGQARCLGCVEQALVICHERGQ